MVFEHDICTALRAHNFQCEGIYPLVALRKNSATANNSGYHVSCVVWVPFAFIQQNVLHRINCPNFFHSVSRNR